MSRTWEDNAQEFGALTKQGKDVRLALLVACSVERDNPGGRPRKTVPIETLSKASARAFATKAGTTAARVLRHLNAWDKLADRKLVKPAAQLEPADALTYEVSEQAIAAFPKVYDASSGNQPAPSGAQVSAALGSRNIRKQAVSALTPEEKDELVREVISSDPKAAQRVMSQPGRAATAIRTAATDERGERAREAIRAAKEKATQARPPTTVSQYYWRILNEFTKWQGGLQWLEDEAGTLKAEERPQVIKQLSELRDQIDRCLVAVEGRQQDEKDDVIDATATPVPLRVLTS